MPDYKIMLLSGGTDPAVQASNTITVANTEALVKVTSPESHTDVKQAEC